MQNNYFARISDLQARPCLTLPVGTEY